MLSKLPPELRVQVTRETASELWEINDILEIIRKELEAREISESVRRSNDELRRPNESWKQNRRRNHNFSVSSLFVKDGKHEGKVKLVPFLVDTIIKFRTYPVGIVSDFWEAFHQVEIGPSDRCMLSSQGPV